MSFDKRLVEGRRKKIIKDWTCGYESTEQNIWYHRREKKECGRSAKVRELNEKK
jgi:hypothetical protein